MFIHFCKRIPSAFVELSSLLDINDVQESEVKWNYGQTGDLAYFEDALCGQEGPRGRRERERDGLPSAKNGGLLLVTDTALTNES